MYLGIDLEHDSLKTVPMYLLEGIFVPIPVGRLLIHKKKVENIQEAGGCHRGCGGECDSFTEQSLQNGVRGWRTPGLMPLGKTRNC